MRRLFFILCTLLSCFSIFLFSDVYIGFGEREITPPLGTPSAGYSLRRGKGMEGKRDPLVATAMTLKTDDKTIVFCTVDHLGYLHQMVKAVEKIVRAQVTDPHLELYISSSHTHSGGGAFINIPVIAERLSGPFDPKVTQFYIEQTASAIVASTQNLTPAKIGIGYGNVAYLSTYRAAHPTNLIPPGALTVIKITTLDDKPLACLFNVAIHPVVLPASNLSFSADFVGEARRALKQTLGPNVVPLFFNGAQGDINPAPNYLTDEPETACVALGDALAHEVKTLWETIPTSPTLHIKTAKHPYSFDVHLPNGWTLPFSTYQTEMNLLVFNHTHAFLTIPGELSCAYDHRLKAFGKELGFAHVSILGLTNDAHGYILLPEAHNARTSESTKSWGGPDYGTLIETKAQSLLQENKP